MEQLFANVGTVGGLAGIAAILAVIVSHFKNRQNNQLEMLIAESKSNSEAFRAQIKAMQIGFDSQLKALTESVTSWKGLWEASTQEIRELKMEIKELRVEIDKLRTENAELKGQLKEHYKLA
ncbi:MAG: keratin [Candidatus Fibromonas sp.]|jgi:peptidoglycan hydrolase CwlO-like protein|nr:keratin [Candidatus Fibromonas sp.]